MPDDPFDPAVAAAVTAHMNEDHADSVLRICRVLGGHATASGAQMTGLDEHGARFAAVVGGAEVPVLVPWRGRPAERADLRAELVAMDAESAEHSAGA